VWDIVGSSLVSGLLPGLTSRRTAYSRSVALRLWRRLLLWVRCAGLAGIASAVAGCSVTTQLGSYFGKDKPAAAAVSSPPSLAAPVDAADLSAVRTAASTMLATGGAGTQWENPATGARGTITPIASDHAQGGTQCRDFLASYVREQSESWLEGEACRNPSGRWDVRSLSPWKRS
jgi:surface antigen